MGWLIALGVFAALSILPLGVIARYQEGGPLVQAYIGPVPVKLYPVQKKKEKKEPAKQKKTVKKKENATVKKKTGGSLTDFVPLVKLALDFLEEFFHRKLRVKRLELKVILAGGDPCDLAVNYGKYWAAVGNLWPLLEKLLIIKKWDVEIECDFTSDKTLVFARVDLSITLGRLLSMAVRYGIRALKEIFKLQKIRKGGASV